MRISYALSRATTGSEEAGSEVTMEVTITSFEDLTLLYPCLARLPGQEVADVILEPKEEELEPTGMVDNIILR